MSAATLSDAQRRLLAAAAQRLPSERVREVYLFAPIRQGGVETGLAVIAAGDPDPPPVPEAGDGAHAGDAATPAAATRPDAEQACDPTDAAAGPPPRFTVYTARYRLQLKGPDRGRWEVAVVEEADAPLPTVDAVVRGVQRRAGELADVERLTGAELVRLLDGTP